MFIYIYIYTTIYYLTKISNKREYTMTFTSIAATLLSVEKRFKRHLLILLFANSSSSKKKNKYLYLR